MPAWRVKMYYEYLIRRCNSFKLGELSLSPMRKYKHWKINLMYTLILINFVSFTFFRILVTELVLTMVHTIICPQYTNETSFSLAVSYRNWKMIYIVLQQQYILHILISLQADMLFTELYISHSQYGASSFCTLVLPLLVLFEFMWCVSTWLWVLSWCYRWSRIYYSQ